MRRIRQAWHLIQQTIIGFFADDALSMGAAIAYYTIFSIAPVLMIVIGIAGVAFGEEAARGAMMDELRGLMGARAAAMVQNLIGSAANPKAGILSTVIGIGTTVLMSTAVFAQMQSSLNKIWKADTSAVSVSALVRARLTSLGLVATLGFILMVSLVLSAGVEALGKELNRILPGLSFILQVLTFVFGFVTTALLFGAVFKILPDKQMEWRDVAVGSVITALLFGIGKFLIGFYIGSSKIASTYGAAAALVILLLWVYYSAQIFLLGAEFTRFYAELHGSHARAPVAPETKADAAQSTVSPPPGA